VIDPTLSDELRITVIATGFADRKEAANVDRKVVEMPKVSRAASPASRDWRRRFAEVRADADAPLDGDLDVPAFLRRQAD
jgi:hypothetical protein